MMSGWMVAESTGAPLVVVAAGDSKTVSQVADEVLYTGLLEMQELPDLSE